MVRFCYESIQWSPFVRDAYADLPAQIAAAGAVGFDGVGIDIWSVDQHLEAGGTLGELADAIEAAGIPCLELQALVATDDEAATLADARHILEVGQVLQPEKVMSGFSGEPNDAAVANYRKAAEVVAPLGAGLGVEFLPMLPLRDLATARDAIRRAGVPGVGVVVDIWHFLHGNADWAELEALPIEEVAFVQFSDHPTLESDDLMLECTTRRVFPGQGVLDVDRFAKTFLAKGYDGIVSCEIISQPLQALGFEEFARQALETAVPYWR